MSEEEKIIHSFPKGDDEQVRLAVHQYKGQDYIDLRVWYLDETSQAFRPTRKGVSIPYESFPELKKGMEKLFSTLQA